MSYKIWASPVSSTIYDIDIYIRVNPDCMIGDSCGGGIPPEPCLDNLEVDIEYNLNSGGWTKLSTQTVNDSCTYYDILSVDTSVYSDVKFRITQGNQIWKFTYTNNSDECPATDTCENCLVETANVVPSSNTIISFTLCTECSPGYCCVPCLV